MPFFERFLSVWVGLAIVAGVALGLAVPGLFQAVAAFEQAATATEVRRTALPHASAMRGAEFKQNEHEHLISKLINSSGPRGVLWGSFTGRFHMF